MTMFFLAGMTAAMGFSAFVVLKVKPSSLGYLGIVGLLSSALWMPYLMALIYINTDKGKPMSGLYKKLDYAPLTAESKLKGQTRSIRMKAFLSWGQFFT